MVFSRGFVPSSRFRLRGRMFLPAFAAVGSYGVVAPKLPSSFFDQW